VKKQRRLKSQSKKASLKTRRMSKLTLERKNRQLFESNTLPFVTAYYQCLIKDAQALLKGSYGFTDATRDSHRITSRLEKEGLSFATTTLPTLMSNFLELLETGEANFPQFKLKKGKGYPCLLGRLIYLAIESSSQTVRSKSFDIVYSICTAFKKLKGEYPDAVLRKQFTDFVEVDKGLANIDWFESETYFILNYARQCCREHFYNVDLSEDIFLPKPGPGATNTPTEKTMRYEPHVLYEQIDSVLPYQEWFYPTPWHACLSARDFLALYNTRQKHPSSRFKFVPKVYGKARGICIEENEMQVMQQALRRGITTLIERDSSLNACLPLDDQSINAQLALQSSTDKVFGTIDMSEASDRVSRELVSWIFQDTPLHDPLMALSTKLVIPPKDLGFAPAPISVNKYAPMGSGLCFPIMSLVHLFLLRGIAYYVNSEDRDLWKTIRVYGDDIIAPHGLIDSVYKLLPKFGMKLNKTKSFYRSDFRESCGVHAYQGANVTPVYIKYTTYHNRPKALASGLEAESSLFYKGFRSTSRFIRSLLREGGASMVPSHPDQGFACLRRPHHDINYIIDRQRIAFEKRWNSSYQTYEYRAPVLVDRQMTKAIEDETSALTRHYWIRPQSSYVVKTKDSESFKLHTIGDSYGDLKMSHRWLQESALNKA